MDFTEPHLSRAQAIAAHIFFFGLFPFYFAYHAITGSGILPPFLPGGAWSVWIFPGAAALSALMAISRNPNARLHAPVVFLAAWVTAYALGYYVVGESWQQNPELLKQSLKLAAGWVCLYGIGFLMPLRPAFSAGYVYALAAMGLSVFFLGPEQLQNGHAAYQGFATSVAFIAMLCLAAAPSHGQPLVLAIALAALLAISSRSDLGGFCIVAVVWFAVMVRERQFSVASAGTGASVLALLVSATLIGLLPNPLQRSEPISTAKAPQPTVVQAAVVRADEEAKSDLSLPPEQLTPAVLPNLTTAAFRNSELLNITQAQSVSIRAELTQKGLKDIAASPFFGVYGGQMREGGIHGTYIHNALSAWRQFGLIPFLLYCFLCIAPAIYAACVVLVRRGPCRAEAEWRATLYVGTFTLVLGLFLESLFWGMPALAWGLLAARKAKRSGGIRKDLSSGLPTLGLVGGARPDCARAGGLGDDSLLRPPWRA